MNCAVFVPGRYRLKITLYVMIALLLIISGGMQSAFAQEHYPGEKWDTVQSLEQAGWNPQKLKLAQDLFQAMGSTAVMIIDDGYVVAEWGDTATPAHIYSVRKSLQSALYGIYAAQGRIRLDATLEDLGIEDNRPGLTKEEKQATVRHLLQARSGVYHPAVYETQKMKSLRPRRGSHAPGTYWYYNNWDFNVLGTIFEKETGIPLFEAFRTSLAEPLGMQDFSMEHTEYRKGPESNHPALIYRLSPRDMARFGLLYLRQGVWKDKRLIPAGWVAESTKSHSEANGGIGYGYLWWTSENGSHFRNRIDGRAFSARGNRGQIILILPAHKLVVVHTNNYQYSGQKTGSRQFGELLKLILQAKEW